MPSDFVFHHGIQFHDPFLFLPLGSTHIFNLVVNIRCTRVAPSRFLFLLFQYYYDWPVSYVERSLKKMRNSMNSVKNPRAMKYMHKESNLTEKHEMKRKAPMPYLSSPPWQWWYSMVPLVMYLRQTWHLTIKAMNCSSERPGPPKQSSCSNSKVSDWGVGAARGWNVGTVAGSSSASRWASESLRQCLKVLHTISCSNRIIHCGCRYRDH